MSVVPLSVAQLAWGYEAPLIEGLELSLAPGELVAIVGPNGVGKSTLLRTLAGEISPLAGTVLLQGESAAGLSAPERARRVAVLAQDGRPDDLLRVGELVELGRTPHLGLWGTLSEDDRRIVDDALNACQLLNLRNRLLAQVSGGEQQRARFAMAVAQQSPLLLLDEPANHLDLRRRYELFELIKKLREELGVAVIAVLHDLAEAYRQADRVFVLARGAAECVLATDPNRLQKLATAFEVPSSRLPF
jgi:iron complex transport system ATP-binding protein